MLRKVNIKKEAQDRAKKSQQHANDTINTDLGKLTPTYEKNSLLVNRHFKVRGVEENGNMSVRKLKGLKRDSEILFVAPPPQSSPPCVNNVKSLATEDDQDSLRVKIIYWRPKCK